MYRYIPLLIVSLFIQNDLSSQVKKAYCIGEIVSIESKILEKSEEFQLYLPKDFSKENNKKYPVLFVMDGNNYFHTVSGIVRQLINAKKIPETIVAGINPDRKYCFDKKLLNKYIDFVEKELQPFIVNNYNAIPYNMLITNSIFGQMGLYSFIRKPDLFQSIILSCPFFNFPDYLIDFELFLENQKKLQNNLFISSGFEEETKIDKIYKLTRKLHIFPVEGLNWSYKQFEKEDKEMVFLLSVIEYLPQIFSDLQIPPFALYSDYKEKFDNKDILFEKYKYDFLDLASCPMSGSRPILEMVLNDREVDISYIEKLKKSPWYFSDNVEMYNLSSYLTSIGKNKAAKQIDKFIEGEVNKELINNYTSNINLSRGLVIDLTLDSINISNIILNGGDVKYAKSTTGMDGMKNSAVELTDKNGRIGFKYNSRIDPRKSVSFSCWIYPYKLKSPDSWAISMKEGSKGPHWNTSVASQDKWGLEIYTVSRFLYMVRDTIQLNQWTNIVFVADQSIGRLTIYKNGGSIYETNNLVPFLNATEVLQIGNDIFSFEGKMDEFKLYQRALSAAEVKQLYLEKR